MQGSVLQLFLHNAVQQGHPAYAKIARQAKVRACTMLTIPVVYCNHDIPRHSTKIAAQVIMCI